MKKGFTKILLTMIFTLTTLFCLQSKDALANNKTYTSEYASYTEQEVLTTNDLGYNIIHNKIKAISTANTCSNPKSGYSLIDSPQQVNMLSVPSVENVRIVNYTFSDSTGWTKQTLSKLVQNFELNNPGWTVLAGVNGDFYDINGKDYALKYHTTGTTVSEGNVLRAQETKSIGYTNNGTLDSFKLTNEVTFTKNHVLTIYDENEEIIKTFTIDKVNETPSGNEIAVYYTYKYNVDTNNDGTNDSAQNFFVTIPEENSYICETPIRCLPTSEPEIYAKGRISTTDFEVELRFGQFGLVTNNEEIKKYLEVGTLIRVQKEVTGDLADCEQIMGVGSTLVENGEVSQDNSDGMRTQRHPRTCIGVKEDGTLMFFVIDGRQEALGYNGMTQDEMGTMMAYYGCEFGVNVDGGGSSTFGIRDEYGNFVIQNSPSDGNERTVSNALLVVVPQLQLNKTNLKDNSIELSYYELSKDIEVNNIFVTIGGITKEMTSNSLIFDGLTAETNYELTYTYDITYKNQTTNLNGTKYQFKTGKVAPSVEYAYFDVNNNNVNLSLKTSDINNLSTFACIDYTDDIEFLDNFGEVKLNIKLSNVQKFDFKIEINYSTGSIPNNNSKITHYFSWYPLSIDMTNLSDTKLSKIEDIIKETNNAIKYVENKNDIISQINASKQEILDIIAWDERIESALESLLTRLGELKNEINVKYSKENQNIIESYLYNLLEDITSVNTLEEFEQIVNEFETKLSEVKTIEEEQEILNNFKKDKINELNGYKNSKNYSKKNNKLANEIVENAINKINSSKTIDEINENLNNAIEELDLIKTKSCKSNTIVIYANILMLISIAYILIKKSK